MASNNFFQRFENLVGDFTSFTPYRGKKVFESLTRITELTWRNVRGTGLPYYSLIPRSRSRSKMKRLCWCTGRARSDVKFKNHPH